MNSIRVDDSDFQRKIGEFLKQARNKRQQATRNVATEILRLSQIEVPHDTGLLQNSGFVDEEGDGSIVGYNKVYAARLHENPQFNFRNGRKGKYLEDPIKHNLRLFKKYFADAFGEGFSA